MQQTKSMKEKAQKIFLRYTLIPLLLVVTVVSVFFFVHSSQMVVQETEASAEALGEALAEVDQDYRSFIETTQQSELVAAYMETQQQARELFQSFYDFNVSQRVKSDFFLFDESASLLLSSAADPDQLTPEMGDFFADSKRLIDRHDGVITRVNNEVYHNGRVGAYAYGAEVPGGYVFYLLQEEDLLDLLFQQPSNVSVITDSHDTIIAASSNAVRDFLNKYRPEMTQENRVLIAEQAFIQAEHREGPFTIYTLNAPATFSNSAALLLAFFGMVAVGTFFLLYYLSRRVSRQLTSSVQGMIDAVAQFKTGEDNYYLREDGDYEVQVLSRQFNAMLDEIQSLIAEKQELAQRHRETEMKQLEAQFQPHFLFNVLESIRYSVRIDPLQAEKSILALSKLLRYSVKAEQEVSLEEELAYLTNYVKLHQLRFGENLHFSMSIDAETKEEADAIFIPKLLFQPLLENAIKYSRAEITKLELCMSQKQGLLNCTVKDNGAAIDEEGVEKLRQALAEEETSQLGIGLFHVHRRLHLIHPAGEGLQLAFQDNGLEVSFQLPYAAFAEKVII